MIDSKKHNQTQVTEAKLLEADFITLEEYDHSWPGKALAEISLIKDTCKFDWIVDIQHIGSTAIAGIKSKPIIDIMVGVTNIAEAWQLVTILESVEYKFWADNPKKDRRVFLPIPPKV